MLTSDIAPDIESAGQVLIKKVLPTQPGEHVLITAKSVPRGVPPQSPDPGLGSRPILKVCQS